MQRDPVPPTDHLTCPTGQPVTPEYLRPADAARFLGISADHLERLRRDGSGPAFSKPSYKLVLYRVSDLREWAGRNTVTNTFHARALVSGGKGAA